MNRKPNPPTSVRPSARRHGCLIFAAVLVILLVPGMAYVNHPRFESSTPLRIEFHADEYPSYREYGSDIADPIRCRTVIDAFKRGTWAMPHMCKASALFKIHYENGAVDLVDFMSGHDGPDFCEIRMGVGHYRLARKELFRILDGAGLDSSKIPVY